MKNLNVIGKDLEIREPDKKEKIETEYPEKINDLKPIKEKNGRAFVTKLFAICGCGVFVFSVLWGAFTKDWDPLTKSSEIVSFIFGYVMSYYF